MSDKFYSEIDELFGDILRTEEKAPLMPSKIIVVDVKTEKPIEGIKYEKMLFDDQLNMYKIADDGKSFSPIKSKNFKAILNPNLKS